MFGAMGYEFEAMLIASYFTLYCTDILLIKASTVGIIFVAVKILDAITDIIVTSLADKTETRLGKYRPWLLFGILLSFGIVLCFSYPSFLHTEAHKVIWVTVILALTVSVFETAYVCPLLIMNTVMSEDSRDRLHFSSAKSIGEGFADLSISFLVMTVILQFGGYKSATGWKYVGMMFAGMTLICVLTGFFGVRERVKVSNADDAGEQMTWLEKLKYLKNNAPFFKLLAVQFSWQIAWFGSMVMFSYYCIYVLGHEEWLASLSVVGVIAQLVVAGSVPKLAGRFSKRHLVLTSCALITLSGAVLALSGSYTGALIFQLLKGCGVGLIYTCTYAMWPEVVDYTHQNTGHTVPGTIYGIQSFTTKLASATSSYLSTLVLTLGMYDGNKYIQSAQTVSWIKYSMVCMLCLCAVTAFIITRRLKELPD